MSTLVRKGTKVADFSFAHPPPQKLIDNNFGGWVGYISVPPASSGKNLTRSECHGYVDAGLPGWLVWEMDAIRPNLGATYGALDGIHAAEQAHARDYPEDVAIISAADLNSFWANIDAHEAYMRAFANACLPYPMGIYGDVDLLARTQGLWQIGWVPIGAWSWSGSSYADAVRKATAVGAHMLQGKGFYIDSTWNVDPNDTIRDCFAWGQDTTPTPVPPIPVSGENDMGLKVTNKIAGKYGNKNESWWVLLDSGEKRHIPTLGELGARVSQITTELDDDQLDQIPDYVPPTQGGSQPVTKLQTYKLVPE